MALAAEDADAADGSGIGNGNGSRAELKSHIIQVHQRMRFT